VKSVTAGVARCALEFGQNNAGKVRADRKETPSCFQSSVRSSRKQTGLGCRRLALPTAEAGRIRRIVQFSRGRLFPGHDSRVCCRLAGATEPDARGAARRRTSDEEQFDDGAAHRLQRPMAASRCREYSTCLVGGRSRRFGHDSPRIHTCCGILAPQLAAARGRSVDRFGARLAGCRIGTSGLRVRRRLHTILLSPIWPVFSRFQDRVQAFSAMCRWAAATSSLIFGQAGRPSYRRRDRARCVPYGGEAAHFASNRKAANADVAQCSRTDRRA